MTLLDLIITQRAHQYARGCAIDALNGKRVIECRLEGDQVVPVPPKVEMAGWLDPRGDRR